MSDKNKATSVYRLVWYDTQRHLPMLTEMHDLLLARYEVKQLRKQGNLVRELTHIETIDIDDIGREQAE